MTAVTLEHCSFSYDDREILHDISGEIPAGEILCIVGPSGSGKTTLLRLLAGLEVPTKGTCLVEIATSDAKRSPGNDKMKGPELAVVFQQDPLFPWMTVVKNVVFAIRCTQAVDIKTAVKRATTILDQVGLTDAAKKYPGQLSGGMKQRAALARALAMERKLLLLDEPFGALNVETRETIHKLLLELWIKNQMTVVCVTHDLREAVTLADRIWLIKEGKLLDERKLSRNNPEKQNAELLEEWFKQEGKS